MKKPHSHCNFCGTEYRDKETWPRVCTIQPGCACGSHDDTGCGNTTWRNPLPVVVALIPVLPGSSLNPAPIVYDPETFIPTNVGVLAVRRAIPPDIGELALPSGYVDNMEDWRAAGVRELAEETELSFKEDDFHLFDVVASKNKKHILVFFRATPIFSNEVPTVSNDEVLEVVLVKDPTELIWDAHQLMVKRLLETFRY